MATAQLLKDVIDSSLEGRNFKKKSNNWYLSTTEVILIVNLQKSQYGEQYYINFSVALKSLAESEFPKEHKGDIRFRLSSVVPRESREQCESALDLENSVFSDEERRFKIQGLFKQGLHVLMQCTSISSIREARANGQLPVWTISRAATELLSRTN